MLQVTVLLGEGNTAFMAGVSAACIAPPLITTVAVLLFKTVSIQNERNAGLVNFILRSTHITEGLFLSLQKIHFAQCLQ